MKFLIVVALAVLAVAQASPYLGDLYGDEGGDGGDFSSGGSYGSGGYGEGRRGVNSEGHGTKLVKQVHNSGHSSDDYDKSVHHHKEDDHNVGGTVGLNTYGRRHGAYNGYNNGHRAYGHHYDREGGY